MGSFSNYSTAIKKFATSTIMSLYLLGKEIKFSAAVFFQKPNVHDLISWLKIRVLATYGDIFSHETKQSPGGETKHSNSGKKNTTCDFKEHVITELIGLSF